MQERSNSHTVVDDSKQVFREFLDSIILRVLTENHEFCPSLLNDPLHEVECNSAHPVSMEHHNLSDILQEDLFQKGKQTFVFEVDAWTNVFDDLLQVWVLFLDEFNLSLEVFFGWNLFIYFSSAISYMQKLGPNVGYSF